MKSQYRLLMMLVVSLCARGESLRGTVTDPSGAAVPGAAVEVRGPGGQHRAKTSDAGQYVFSTLAPGRYEIRVAAKGFDTLKQALDIDRAVVFDARMAIATDKQVVNVEDRSRAVSAEPGSNGSAVFLGPKELAALSDDPDELALQLQALAGPAPGPDGGQMYVDGFSDGNLPPKSAIREVRINSNPFSPEYDKPGFSRIEIFTKPGSESFHGEAFTQFNDAILDSRNPLLTSSSRAPYRTQMYGFNLGGPLRKNKASFTFDSDYRRIGENAFVLATTPDSVFNEAIETPETRMSLTPRLDYAINARNTLVARYQELRLSFDNLGIGDFNLPSRGFNETQRKHIVQLTETAVLSPRAINETRFEASRFAVRDTPQSTAPAIVVLGAFSSGGATGGNSGSTTTSWELSNITTLTKGKHIVKWGGRVRQSLLTDTSRSNYAGTFTFLTLGQYRAMTPWQFTMNAGAPTTRVSQADAGVFVNDDWRLRPNLTLSAGLRYEAQGNRGDLSDWAPRVGVAWGIDGKGSKAAKTVLRAGAGIFYDRIPVSVTLNSERFNGTTQQSFLISDPTFFPAIPPLEGGQPQLLRPVFDAIRAPRMVQTSAGVERQLSKSARVSATWIDTRGVHLINVRNINTPIGGVDPYGDASIRLLTESAGLSRQNQLVVNTNVNYRKIFLFGYYAYSRSMDNNEGIPADPYNLRAEWGPATVGDVRHRVALGASIPLRWRFMVNPFIVANSGQPYNITTGLDPENTGYPEARPALLGGVSGASCTGVYAAGLGCFDLTPAAGTPTITRNFGRGPAAVNLVLRVARTWAFGGEGRSGVTASQSGGSHGEGPPAGMFNTNTGQRYNLTLSASTLNALNHANYAPPDGDLTSPYFGQYRNLGGMIVMLHGGGASTYNRKIDLQLRFTF